MNSLMLFLIWSFSKSALISALSAAEADLELTALLKQTLLQKYLFRVRVWSLQVRQSVQEVVKLTTESW